MTKSKEIFLNMPLEDINCLRIEIQMSQNSKIFCQK